MPVIDNHILTAEDIRALRLCDSVCFDHNTGTQEDSWRWGIGRIRCYKAQEKPKRPKNSPFQGEDTYLPDLEYAFDVPSKITTFDTYASLKWNEMRAYTRISSYYVHFKTLVQFVKPGDEIFLQWQRDCNSQLIEEANLHLDTLDVLVTRGSGKTAQSFYFRLESSICKNNSARLIRDFAY